MSSRNNGKPVLCEIAYGGQRIPVSLSRGLGDRLSISVHPDQRVTAVAPANRSLEEIARRLRARAGWIARQMQTFEKFVPAPVRRRYVSGETHLYLGRQYRLRVRRADKPRVSFDGRYIRVETHRPRDARHVRQQLTAWYRERAGDVLQRRFVLCSSKMRLSELPGATVSLRLMTRRWGSCTRSGRILLNPELVKAPVQCIDYVIVHELCHLQVLRHDKHFYSLLARYLPDWERRKERLDRIALPPKQTGVNRPRLQQGGTGARRNSNKEHAQI